MINFLIFLTLFSLSFLLSYFLLNSNSNFLSLSLSPSYFSLSSYLSTQFLTIILLTEFQIYFSLSLSPSLPLSLSLFLSVNFSLGNFCLHDLKFLSALFGIGLEPLNVSDWSMSPLADQTFDN